MNIGIDIDGTLTKYPDFFIELGKLWRAAGHKVYLITGLGLEGVAQKEQEYPFISTGKGVFYDELCCTNLYNSMERALIGKVSSNEEIVGRFKQRLCFELNIEIMFDDQAQIHRQFGPTPIFEVK